MAAWPLGINVLAAALVPLSQVLTAAQQRASVVPAVVALPRFAAPSGGVGAVMVGASGAAIAGARGPNGGAVLAGRGAWGNSGAVARLPNGAAAVRWNGNNYWQSNGRWYSPYWYNDAVWYTPIYPPVGWYTPDIYWGTPEPVVIDNTTYYESEGVYYEKTTKDGQQGYAVVAEPETPAPAADPNLPNPFDVLKKGLAYLATQPQFHMNIADSYDEVTSAGQKISYSSYRDIYVTRPQNIAVDFRGDTESRRAVFDGKTITLVDLTKNAYGQAPLPGTIDEALDKLATDYGVVVPAAELMRTNLYDRVSAAIQTGQYLGRDKVALFDCDHVGFTTPAADWEAWFSTGDQPLLRKYSVAYKNVPARPRYTMTILNWNTSDVADTVFAVKIPEGAQQVPLKPRQAEEASPR